MKGLGAFDLPRKIVMLSTADWDAPLWTNKQQIADRLAPYYDIIYVEPVAGVGSAHRSVLGGSCWQADNGVTVYRPAAALPFGQKVWAVNRANTSYVTRAIRELMDRRGFVKPIVWCYPPNSQPFLDNLPHAVSCYDCVDDYSAFPGAWATVTRRMEQRLLRKVDAVFTTAQSLFDAKKQFNKNTYFVPNVADFDHFNQAMHLAPAQRIADLPHPVIGFVGALNFKIDGELLKSLFELRPNWSFVFVGPDRGLGIDRFLSCRNAHFVGRKEINELPGLMAGFDACMIPYSINRYIRSVLPLKFFEYLATGKPIVSTPMPELEKFAPLVDLGSNADELVHAIERRLGDDPHVQQRLALARENSWEHRINRMLSILETVQHEKSEALL